MSLHTPGPVRIHENGDANEYALLEAGADGRWLLTLQHNGHQATERQRANMRRLAACWNACQNIETEVLEQNHLGVIAAEHSMQLHTKEKTMSTDKIDDGGPAFPTQELRNLATHTVLANASQGMSLRDRIAIAAMQGYISNPSHNSLTPETRAKFAYRQADEMLTVREKA